VYVSRRKGLPIEKDGNLKNKPKIAFIFQEVLISNDSPM
jgi:hypothetical protein